tara:strand:- start:1400 stop:1807 length:408 start_codon:yes stop_codon:yes gene_type:complete
MRTMTPTERAYVAGIIDGEGWVEFKRVKRRRNTRPGKPTYLTLIIRMEVPQVDRRLIDYLMETTGEGSRDMKYFPKNPTWSDQHRWRASHHGVYRVLKQVYKYLIVKREKAKLIVDHYDKKFAKKVFGKGGFGTK